MRIHGTGFVAAQYAVSLVLPSLFRAGPVGLAGRLGPTMVAPHAGAHRGEPGVGGLERREVAVDAVQAERLHVHRMREVDRLNGCTALGGGTAPVAPRFVGRLLGELRGALRGSEKLPL